MKPHKTAIKPELMLNKTATSPKDEFWHGVRDELPMMLGVIPFGLVFGVLGISSGLTALQTILMSSILFGGASQVV
ncbi:MAG: AzlC family ABC transporter permease, partial [Candidatus Puniceispirillaceae bacterium]